MANKVLFGVYLHNVYFITSNIKRDIKIEGIHNLTKFFNFKRKVKKTKSNENYNVSIININQNVYSSDFEYFNNISFSDFFTDKFIHTDKNFAQFFNQSFTLGFFVFKDRVRYSLINITSNLTGKLELDIYDDIDSFIHDFQLYYEPKSISVSVLENIHHFDTINTNTINSIKNFYREYNHCTINFPFSTLLLMNYISDEIITKYKNLHINTFVNHIWEELIQKSCTPNRLIQWNEDYNDLINL